MSKLIKIQIAIVILCCSVIPMRAQEANYESLPREMKKMIFSFIGVNQSLSQVIQNINTCKILNQESRALLSQTHLLVKILARSSCWKNTRLAPLPARKAPYRGLLHYCYAIDMGQSTFPLYDEPCQAFNTYLQAGFSKAERKALCSFMAQAIARREIAREFFIKLKNSFFNKTMLLDLIILEAEEFFECTFQCFNLDGSTCFTYRSLDAQKRILTHLTDRFEKFKLLVPFYLQLLKSGNVPLQLPILMRSQVQEFADHMKNSAQKKELLTCCILLLPHEYDPRYKEMYEEYIQELQQPPSKRLALDDVQARQ